MNVVGSVPPVVGNVVAPRIIGVGEQHEARDGSLPRGRFADLREPPVSETSARGHPCILMTAKAAPSGSARTAKRPGGMSVGGTRVVAPSSAALETEASVSSTPK